MPKSFKITTLGCKVNQYESAYLHESLEKSGMTPAGPGVIPDIAVINTCIVTQTAAHQSRQEIRKAIRQNPAGPVIATGCYAHVFPDELQKIEGLDLIAGNAVKKELPEMLLKLKKTGQNRVYAPPFAPGSPFHVLPVNHFPGRTRAFLKIQDGCQSFCSYCIVPFGRGHYRSLPPHKVLATIESLAAQGYKEIVLTGIHLGKYGVDLKNNMNLVQLLSFIGQKKFPLRVRLSSLNVNEISEALIDMATSETWLCRHFHIPLQSGDNRVLKRMNRHYTCERFEQVIRTIHDKIPLAGIGVDVMCGFPGEDTAAYANTLSLLKHMPVSYLHVFPFSPRPSTPAAAFENRIDPSTIKERAVALRKAGMAKKKDFFRKCLKKQFIVLPEQPLPKNQGLWTGKSDNYLPVIFPSPPSPKELVSVFMTDVEDNRLRGTVLDHPGFF